MQELEGGGSGDGGIAHCRLGELQNAKQRKITERRHTESVRERENILMPALPLRVARAGGEYRGVGI